MSHQPTGTEAVVAAFTFNRNIHQAKLDWRFNEQFTDPRWATAYVGAELLAQQERAGKRYDQQSTALRSSVDEQTRQSADHARILLTTIKESSAAVRREMTNVKDAVDRTTEAVSGLTTQVAHLAWLQAEQNTTLRNVLDTIREGRANECRQLVEQGERNFHAGFLTDAEERFRLALGFDNTDYPTHQNLGLTLVGVGRLDEALAHFKKALAFPPKGDKASSGFFVARAATHAARVLYATGDYAGAELYLKKALDADATGAKNWYDLAVMRTYQGNGVGAIEALQRAFEGDVLFAGAALSDEELAPIRLMIEDLVIAQTRRAMGATVDAPADELRKLNRRVAEIARNVGVEVKPADVDRIVSGARTSATLPATKDAFMQLQKERTKLISRAREALRTARAATEQEMENELRSLKETRDGHIERSTANGRARLSATSSRMSAPVQVVLGIVGFILGAVAARGAGCGGAVLAGGVGALVLVGLYAVVFHAGKSSSTADVERIAAEENEEWEEIQAEEASINKDAEARLKLIARHDDELFELFTPSNRPTHEPPADQSLEEDEWSEDDDYVGYLE